MTEPTDADTTSRQLRSVAQALDEDKLDRDYFPRVAGLIRETAAERDRLLALVAAQADQIADLQAWAEHWERVMVVVTDQAAEYVTTFAWVRALLDSATELAPGSVRAYFADDIRAALDGTEATP